MSTWIAPGPQTQTSAQHGLMLVAAGLALLIAANWWPGAPVTTAMALVALGATRATVARWAAAPLVLVTHTTAYVTLYALFFGSACHAMAARGDDAWRVVDLVVSTGPMAVAVVLAIVALASHKSTVL